MQVLRTPRLKSPRGRVYFTGRVNETRVIIRALERGRNVVLSGKYGIGRSGLVQHVADTVRETWHFVFVDLSQTPAGASNELLSQLCPGRKRQARVRYVRYRASRFQIANLDLEDQRRYAIVLDNIGAFTRSRQEFVRYLSWEGGFRFVAIAEAFLPKEEHFRLRALLRPARTLSLGYLPASSSRAFYRHYARRYGFGWTEERIAALTRMTGGYPLGMKETVMREKTRGREYVQPRSGPSPIR